MPDCLGNSTIFRKYMFFNTKCLWHQNGILEANWGEAPKF